MYNQQGRQIEKRSNLQTQWRPQRDRAYFATEDGSVTASNEFSVMAPRLSKDSAEYERMLPTVIARNAQLI